MDAFINAEVCGLGIDIQNGMPSRPFRIEVCTMDVIPDDSQRCAIELTSKDIHVQISTFNFLGNHFPIYAVAGVPVFVKSSNVIGDFTTSGVFSIGGGGGWLGVYPGQVELVTGYLGGKRVGVPWVGTLRESCYDDREEKALEVFEGAEFSASERAGTLPDLEFIGVPMKPATPDTSRSLAQVLDFDPVTFIVSAQT